MKALVFLITIVIMVFISGCNSEKRELKKYNELKSGLKYTAYNTVSANTFPLLIKSYNEKRADSLKIDEDFTRLLLGFSWQLSGQYAFCVSEALTVIGRSTSSVNKSTAHSLLASVMFENGWRRLGAKENAEAEKLMKEAGNIPSSCKYSFLLQLILASEDIYKTDFADAKIHLAGFAKETGISWPVQLAEVFEDIKNNKKESAIDKLNKLMKDNSLPDKAKELVVKKLETLIKNPSLADKMTTLPSDFFKIIIADLAKSKNSGISNVMQFIEELKGKVSFGK
ncbi:MAG: hypothetical protein HY958_09800 [Bacteroidia bacterium]|nr:hypothetical protein [Bacteroidia bacterium]